MPLTPELAENEGQALASKCSWNGDDILKICQAALTDANFHREAEVIGKMIEAIDTSDDPHYLFAVSSNE